MLELRRRFYIREVRYDPWQMQAVAQRLITAGVPMVEFPQSVPNLTEASTNLYECIKGRNLVAYQDADMRLAISRCVAIETSRGWRIAKEKQSHKIDVIVALAQAALGAVQQGQVAFGMDAALQARLHEAVSAARRARDGGELDRLHAHGEDVARDEDGASMALPRRWPGSRWSGRGAW